ncbi:undecaprenyl/decaprenyl-phosphate alpha-N-acetylglucosaminyl 1-phosphate transferase [Leucobacter sp. CSA1]|uniref:Undecaprenyl/decaprenyl-phosphate alpha-N-acetylglucosaminyl 1-phosphate transferase n=1 Tax=Leucobacter chromiisoli TaxID=2796471 RepID=A0A934Q4Y8_9MICO|nr:MraY family glycosyltransferase [Leucobacter chromiisoli]MBK0418439.1 undecaprenyl/decaprenyl-phosphate alpha-N-acetylglucosaminyl 1-phosphate transferase [Leucobacter chromiisoli]
MTSYLVVAAVAALVTAAASFVVLQLSRRFRLAPEVRARDVHRTPTPRLGGVAMFLGIVAAFVVGGSQSEFEGLFADPAQMWAVLGACALIAVVGVLDDLLDLDWMIKLAAQLAAAGLLAWQGVQIVSLPFGDTLIVASPALNFVLTVFLMTLVMNAVNFVDGLDGLVAGVAIIANSVFFIYTRLLTEQTGRVDAVTLASLIAAVIVGMCAGFLPFNWHRARMFMGDTGALLVGLLMATSTVSVTGQLNPAALDQKLVLASYIPIILPIAVLALPLADFVMAVIRRLLAGKSPFTADRQHLHHRLLDLGHSPLQAVLVFYLGTAVLSVACLLAFTMQSFLWPVVVLLIGTLLCIALTAFPASRVRRAAAQRGLLRWERPEEDAIVPGTETPDTPLRTAERGSANERTPE